MLLQPKIESASYVFFFTKNNFKKLLIVGLVFCFSGVPPFFFFVFKILIILKIKAKLVSLIIFSITNTFILFYYINFLYNNMGYKNILVKQYLPSKWNSVYTIFFYQFVFNLYVVLMLDYMYFFIYFMFNNANQSNIRRIRIFRKPYKIARIMRNKPQNEGTVLKVRITAPRKPNSARRKTLKLRLNIRLISITYVSGGNHNLKKFSKVLIRGKGARDLPGVYTTAIRNKKDLEPATYRSRRRSIYGIQKQ
jgi:small subunit ribosomal protein S12